MAVDQKLKNDIVTTLGKLKNTMEKNLKMFIGIDGFVDEIIHAVRKRYDFKTYDRIETIAELGERISKSAGLSMNLETVPQQLKLGGNGPIFANALIEYGVGVTYTGALGKPNIHPVFKAMAERSTVYSLAEPGHTDALEFADGKIMIGKLQSLNEITWVNFKEAFGNVTKIAELIKTCDLFGMENWTMVPYMSEIWEGIIKEVFPLLPDKKEKPLAFFDLADPEKRNKEDILEAMKLIGRFEEKFRTILGLNEKEAYEIAEVFDIKTDPSLESDDKLKHVVTAIYAKLGIYCLVVHPTREAVACTAEGYFHTFGPFCQKPLLTTGAGDNFNAGFCLGQALGLDIQSSLISGVSTSGSYVRNAKSPTFDALLDFLQKWSSSEV